MQIPSIKPPGIPGRLSWALLMLVALGGCAVSLVAPYDAATFEEILKVGKKVDRFYGDLMEVPEKRPYRTYAEKYVDIETELRSLHLRNQARPLNQESIRIVEIMLDHWIAYKKLHQARNDYPTARAELHRQRFTRLFVAAADAEKAKKLATEDREAGDTK